jgi:thiol-disulfide isomerase/thioredoxin
MRYLILLFVLLAPPAWADDSLILVGPDGGDVELQPTEGQVLVVHFWATWCPTCIEDIRHLQNAVAACSNDRVRAVLVNVGEDAEVIREFVKDHDVKLLVLRDPKGRLWRRTEGRGVPANLFWSNEGKKTDVGPKTESEWRSSLAAHGCSTNPG